MDGKLPVGDIALAEADELSFNAALFAGHRNQSCNLKVDIMFFHLGAQDMIFRQVEYVIGHAGHAVFSLWGPSAIRAGSIRFAQPGFVLILSIR